MAAMEVKRELELLEARRDEEHRAPGGVREHLHLETSFKFNI